MCTQPISIKNTKIKANTFIHGVDKTSFLVPCGHCPACIQRRIDDFTFRGYMEYLYTIEKGGFVLFQTLTYSELNVPYNQGFRFFSKDDCQKFLKKLRIRLSRAGYDVDNKLKYILTSEYGGKYHRPHYHILFFVTFAITPAVFDAFVEHCWTKLRSSGEVQIGRVDDKIVSQRIVNSIYGIRYVCKYVSKGTSVIDAIKYSYVSRSHINQFVFDFCQSNGLNFGELQDFQVSKIWKVYLLYHPDFPDKYQLMPFVLQSHNIGMDFLYKNDLEEGNFEFLLDIVQIKDFSPKGYKNYQVPMYYIRKVFYNYDKNSKRYILNEFGRKYLDDKYVKMVDDYFDFIHLDSAFIDSLIEEKSQGKYHSFRDAVNSILSESSIDSFVYYIVYLQGREINPAFYFLDLKCVDARTLAQLQHDISMDCYVNDCAYFLPEKFSNLFNKYIVSDFKFGDLKFYDDLPQFFRFNELFDIILKVKQVMASAMSAKIGEVIRKDKMEKAALAEISSYDNYSIIF